MLLQNISDKHILANQPYLHLLHSHTPATLQATGYSEYEPDCSASDFPPQIGNHSSLPYDQFLQPLLLGPPSHLAFSLFFKFFDTATSFVDRTVYILATIS